MSLDESRFTTLANEMLERIADKVDELLGDEIDAELQGGILTLSIESGGQYIINRHTPNREIWMSSPASGATHFGHADGRWISTREPKSDLAEMLAAELKDKFGVAVEI